MHWFFKLLKIVGAILLPLIFVLVVLPKLLPSKHLSNTEVYGLIIGNQVWEGTIRIKGDIITLATTSIVLKPGTKLLMATGNDRSNLDFLPWHKKSGINTSALDHGVRVGEPFWDESQKIQIHFSRLTALGTKEQPIIITSESISGSPYDFNSITIGQGVLTNVVASNYRRLEIGDKVTIRDSQFKDTGECSICVKGGAPVIMDNIFENSLRESIWLNQASPKISNNLFNNLGGAGIRVDPQVIGQPNIFQNSFEMPGNLAIDILSGEETEGGVVSFNYFSGNSLIRLPCDSKIKIVENSLLGLFEFVVGSCNRSYTFGSNFWGTDDIKVVLNEKIINKEKKFQILIPFLLKEPPQNVGR